jgi:hypothetical protein
MHFPFTASQPCKIQGRAARPRRHRALPLLVALLALGAKHPDPSPPAVTPSAPHETTLRGEVVENGCFIIGGRKGEPHRHCARTCALAGENLGLLDDETKLLFVVVQDVTAGPQPNPLLPWIAQRVEIRGVTVERGGVNGVIVRQVRPLNPPPAKR